MSDYPRSHPPPRYESGYRDRPDYERDRRRNESQDRDVPRYREDGPVAAPPASRHAVRVDFSDFDRGSYRSPSPLRYQLELDIIAFNYKQIITFNYKCRL